jgi:glycosyltransferase involved in cell wall biosynthesis
MHSQIGVILKVIVHIVEACATGTLSMVALVANLQVKKGYNVTIVYSERSETPKNLREIFDSRIDLHSLNMGPRSFPLSVVKLRAILKLLQPEIVHCHSSFAGFVGRLASIGKKHDVFYSPHCIAFMRQDIGWFKRQIFRVFESVASVCSATYVACSQSEQQEINKALPFANVKLLENAVDLTDFTQSKVHAENLGNERIKVITVGGIRPQKGPTEYAQIANKFKQKNVEFIWIGDGDIEYKQVLLDAGVTITGWMSREEVIAELYKADVYISTALWEGMPVSIIEACAANLPVIARNCAGNKDIISSGNNGYLFDETKQCIDLLDNYLAEPSSFEELARQAHDQVFTRFSVERFAEELDEIYKN